MGDHHQIFASPALTAVMVSSSFSALLFVLAVASSESEGATVRDTNRIYLDDLVTRGGWVGRNACSVWCLSVV